MFGFVIGGSGKLYLQVPVRFGEEWWPAWRPIYSHAEYRLLGRRGGCYRILLNNPTMPHALTGKPSDPPRGSGFIPGRSLPRDQAVPIPGAWLDGP